MNFFTNNSGTSGAGAGAAPSRGFFSTGTAAPSTLALSEAPVPPQTPSTTTNTTTNPTTQSQHQQPQPQPQPQPPSHPRKQSSQSSQQQPPPQRATRPAPLSSHAPNHQQSQKLVRQTAAQSQLSPTSSPSSASSQSQQIAKQVKRVSSQQPQKQVTQSALVVATPQNQHQMQVQRKRQKSVDNAMSEHSSATSSSFDPSSMALTTQSHSHALTTTTHTHRAPPPSSALSFPTSIDLLDDDNAPMNLVLLATQQFNQKRSHHLALIESLELKLSQKGDEVVRVSAELNEERQLVERVSAVQESLKLELDAVRRELSHFDGVVKNLERYKKETELRESNIVKESDKITTEIVKLRTENELNNSKLESTTAGHHVLQAKFTEKTAQLSTATTELSHAEQTLAYRTQELADARVATADLQTKLYEASTIHKQELSALQTELRQALDEMRTAQSTAASLSTTVTHLTQTHETQLSHLNSSHANALQSLESKHATALVFVERDVHAARIEIEKLNTTHESAVLASACAHEAAIFKLTQEHSNQLLNAEIEVGKSRDAIVALERRWEEKFLSARGGWDSEKEGLEQMICEGKLELSSMIEKNNGVVNGLKADVGEKERLLAECQGLLDAVRDELGSEKEERVRNGLEVMAMCGVVEGMKEEYGEFVREKDATKASLEERISVLETEICAYIEDIRRLNQSLEVESKRANQAEDDNLVNADRHEIQVRELQEQLNLQTTCSQELLDTRSAATQQADAQKQEEVASLNAIVDKLEKEVERIKLDLHKEVEDTMANVRAEQAELREEVAAKNLLYTELQTKLVDFEEKIQEERRCAQDIIALKEQEVESFQESMSELAECRVALNELQTMLESNQKSAESNFLSLKRSSDSDSSKLNAIINELEAKLESETDAVRTNAEKTDSLQNELNSIRKILDSKTGDVERLNNENRDLRVELGIFETRIQSTLDEQRRQKQNQFSQHSAQKSSGGRSVTFMDNVVFESEPQLSSSVSRHSHNHSPLARFQGHPISDNESPNVFRINPPSQPLQQHTSPHQLRNVGGESHVVRSSQVVLSNTKRRHVIVDESPVEKAHPTVFEDFPATQTFDFVDEHNEAPESKRQKLPSVASVPKPILKSTSGAVSKLGMYAANQPQAGIKAPLRTSRPAPVEAISKKTTLDIVGGKEKVKGGVSLEALGIKRSVGIGGSEHATRAEKYAAASSSNLSRRSVKPASARTRGQKRQMPVSNDDEVVDSDNQEDVQLGAIPLRDYQSECISTSLERLAQGVKRQAVSLPVGSGKTVIFSNLIAQVPVPETVPTATRALVIAHRTELLHQAHAQIKRLLPDSKVLLEKGQQKPSPQEITECDVMIASIQTLGRFGSSRIDRLDPKQFKCIIIDEAHHAASNTYVRALKKLGALLSVKPMIRTFLFGVVPPHFNATIIDH
ncbi:hypothetical protein HDU79_008371 [Rhizoclosmatium sp. JEL0117]|nr:hypothetical protein HDU79_008371 [Rhizoclosmatium sp. JEL0117]